MEDTRAEMWFWETAHVSIAEVRHGLLIREKTAERSESALFVFARGKNARIEVGKTPYRVLTHALLHVPKGRTLIMDALDGELEYYWAAYRAELPPSAGRETMRRLIQENPLDREVSLRPENAVLFETEFRRMLEAWRSGRERRGLWLKSGFYAMLDGFCAAQIEQTRPMLSVDSVKQAQTYLEANFAQSHSLETLAHMLGMSRTTLYEHFKARVGQSPQQYLMSLRLEAARAHLLGSGMTTQEIAVSCGLIDKGYFSRVFQKRYGMPPSLYRKAHRKSEAPCPAKQADAKKAVTIENLGRTHRYDAVPRRIVCLNYSAAEMIAALGMADRLVGLSGAEGALSDCAPEYQGMLSRVPLLPCRSPENHTPDFQAVLSCRPDLAIGTAYSFDMPGGIEDADAFERENIHVYALKATYTLGSTLEDTYEDIANLGLIMGCPERAASLIARMKTKQREWPPLAQDRAPVRVFSFDAPVNGRAFTCGCSLEASMIRAAGGINVFESRARQFAAVEWEEVARANPQVIVVHRFFDGDDGERKAAMLRRIPELARTDAIRDDRIYIIGMKKVFPAIDNAQTVEQLARWFNTHSY